MAQLCALHLTLLLCALSALLLAVQAAPHPHRRHVHASSMMDRLGAHYQTYSERRRSLQRETEIISSPIKATFVKGSVRSTASRTHVINPAKLLTGFDRYGSKDMISTMKTILLRMH